MSAEIPLQLGNRRLQTHATLEKRFRSFYTEYKEEPLFLEHKFNSVREVWEFFAQGVWAEYYEDFNELSKRILELTDKDSIIAVFTAWDLDYQIRKLLKLC